ncbi:MAG TPA: PSD1 and planctomycete cytochrome C domain-containing protein [Pirellulales bacterium]|nr:PSD1 and planctomycete cytochrome C domain-containing protein [Pirellulales bacterium]
MTPLRKAGVFCAIVLMAEYCTTNTPAQEPATSPEQVEFFEKEVRPLLVENCHKCHGSLAQKGNLRLDSRSAVLTGGDTGPAVAPGKPDESLLIDAVSYGDLYQMPPAGKLADKQVAVLRRWVELGAPWPAEVSTADTPTNAPAQFDLEERAKHWAFQPPDEQPLPEVKNKSWPQSPSDTLLLSRLEDAGLTPVEPAERSTLLRRASFDLIGLPPTADQIEAFLADDRPDAFARVVDRLLASPHFGERWGRHWLDLVRYAESKGHEFDYNIPNAWQYRDYVIRAFNGDVPYDEFVVEHVAGDLLAEPRRHPQTGSNESLLGTGFWFLGEENHSPVDLRADELDHTDNKIDVFSKTFLAMTVACARCHDHKFDAISTKDYYALSGYLISGSYRQAPFDALDTERTLCRQIADVRASHRAELLEAVHAATRPTLERLNELLLATREVLQASGTQESAAAARNQAIESVAAGRQLSPVDLAQWVEAVRQAEGDTASPLRPWAVMAASCGGTGAGPTSLVASLSAREAKNVSGQAAPDAAATVVVDYSSLSDADWRQDGFTFGPAPLKSGELSFGASAEQPIARVWNKAAAVSDPFWDAATLAPGVEREPGRLSWLQSGRTLRTPTFTLDGGKLYYLVSGSGYAYAAVYSHRMNNGPLHGALVREWQAGERFQWIEHDLSAYRGQRVHIEFSPRQPGETKADASPILAIAQVVESERIPADPNLSVMSALAFLEADFTSPEALALAYARALKRAADGLFSGGLSAGDADLANWLVHRLDLFVPAGEVRQHLAERARPFIEAQAALAAALPREIHTAPAMLEGSGVDERVLLRGNPKTPADFVPRRYLEVLGGTQHSAHASESGRLELARQIVDPSRPLAARVMVNRVWQHLFGRGIVASADNFGVLGERPTNRALLDRLAGDFMLDGWSVKRLIRRLMLSSAYQLSSRPSEVARQTDPDNLLISHQAVKRLEAEVIRDNVLAVSGHLNQRMLGVSTPIYLSEFMEGRGRPASGSVDGDGRRSVYLSVRRNFLSTFFLAFDYPVPFTAVGRRSVSNVPGQALTMMNSPLVAAEARRWAERLASEPLERAQRIEKLYVAAFARRPTDLELQQAVEFLSTQAQRYSKPVDSDAWADLCHVLMNAKEFIFVE